MSFTQINRPMINLTPSANQDARRAAFKEKLEEWRSKFAKMSDEDLDLEVIGITDHIETIRIELEAEELGHTSRGAEWRIRALRALNMCRAESKIAHNERRVRSLQADARMAALRRENLVKQQAIGEQAAVRKIARIEKANEENRRFSAAFLAAAKTQLPTATYERILASALDAVRDGA
jgi:hypothetical protein